MSINELLEVRLEACMCFIGGRPALAGGRDDWVELAAQWNGQTSTQRFPCPLSRCLQEHKKQWGDAWIIYLTQTTSTAPSYSEPSRNNEDVGGRALGELWTESLSHCRPPELQLREVGLHTGSKTTNSSNLWRGFTSTKRIIIFLLLALIYGLDLKHREFFWCVVFFFHSWCTSHAHSSLFLFHFGSNSLFFFGSMALKSFASAHRRRLPRTPNNIPEQNTQVNISKVLVMPAALPPLPQKHPLK